VEKGRGIGVASASSRSRLVVRAALWLRGERRKRRKEEEAACSGAAVVGYEVVLFLSSL
jgi:hypothetical protein